MVKRRKLLIGMGALAAGSAAGIGTGALSAVSTGDRPVTVTVADDSEGYLQFGTTETEIGGIDNNELELDFDENVNGGDGVNVDSIMYFDDVFEIRNRGTDGEIKIWATVGDDLDDYLDLYPISGGSGRGATMVGESNAVSASFDTGTSDKLRVGVEIDLRGSEESPGELSGSIQIHAKEDT
jgi:hypothetical protein